MTFSYIKVIQKVDFFMRPNSRGVSCRCSMSWRRQCGSEVKAPGMRSSFRPWHCRFSGEELASRLISLCLGFLTYKMGMIISALLPTGHCEKVYVHITSVMFLCATRLYEMIINTTQGAPFVTDTHQLWSKREGQQAFIHCMWKHSTQLLAHRRPSVTVH